VRTYQAAFPAELGEPCGFFLTFQKPEIREFAKESWPFDPYHPAFSAA
jgi:hypothetical protein